MDQDSSQTGFQNPLMSVVFGCYMYYSASYFYAKILKILHISKEIDVYFADIQLININSVTPS